MTTPHHHPPAQSAAALPAQLPTRLPWLGLLCALALLLVGPAHAKRVALLMGNASYQVGRLTNPPNDVAEMEKALKALRFDVQKVLNADQNQMKRAVRDFGTAAQGADVAFVYYSGHATQASGENYLLPVKATIEKESDYAIEAIAANDVLAQIRGANPKAAILVLDACRDNPLAATTRSATKGLRPMSPPSGMLIAFATEPHNVASDNGNYARVLAAELQKPGQELLDVFRNTGAEVKRLSGGRQEPRISEVSINERLYLLASVKPEPDPAYRPPVPGPSQGGGLNLEALKREDESKKGWAQWQGRMRADLDQANAMADTGLRAKALELFLNEYKQDNPWSGEDEELRAQASSSVQRLRAQGQPAQPGQAFKDCADCPELVVIPAGSFVMGSSAAEQARANAAGLGKDVTDRESPQHRVSIGRFALGKFEVSRGEFGRFVASSGYRTEAEQGDGCFVLKPDGSDWEKKAGANWKTPGFAQADDHPVVCVSWNDARAYVDWLNRLSPGRGFRLASEAEWEYAARAGSQTAYPWGDDEDGRQLCNHANHGDLSYSAVYTKDTTVNKNCTDGVVHTAGGQQFGANAFGLHHMHGNALEWVQDCFEDNYSQGQPTDGSAHRGNDSSCSRRVLRGGAWGGYPVNLRSAYRNRYSPDFRNGNYGFRIARTVP